MLGIAGQSPASMWFKATSLRRLAGALAAILLVLNWTAPGRTLSQAAFGASDIPAGYSPSTVFASPGTLPRVAPRPLAAVSALPSGPHTSDPATGDAPFALTPAGLLISPARAASAPAFRIGAAPRILTPRAFNARAPPRLTA
ncbi:MAG: hypothetical protein Q8M26_12080 [Pseudolabrys sp.]|nr:hypothetical protein [Pseudolabrys sp.]